MSTLVDYFLSVLPSNADGRAGKIAKKMEIIGLKDGHHTQRSIWPLTKLLWRFRCVVNGKLKAQSNATLDFLSTYGMYVVRMLLSFVQNCDSRSVTQKYFQYGMCHVWSTRTNKIKITKVKTLTDFQKPT